MSKTNKFHVKEIKNEVNYTVEEERKDHSPLYWFFRKNLWIIYGIVMLVSIIISAITIYAVSRNIKESTIVEYSDSGVTVTFNEGNNSILNGTPITESYASKLFDGTIANDLNKGVVIRVKEATFDLGTIVYYSDKTVLIKYSNGNYVKVKALNNDYGVMEDGTIKSGANSKNVSYEYKNNEKLGIELLYLSDGTVEITKGNLTILLRNQDLTSTPLEFYTNLSGVSVPVIKENNKIIFSEGSVKEDNYIIVNGVKHYPIKEETIHDNIKIIYYDNDYAEVIHDEIDLLVEKSEHIKYDDNIFEIVDGNKQINIKDLIDIKDLELDNKNNIDVNYVVVLEETSDYAKHNVSRRLPTEYINYRLTVKDNDVTGILNNNIKDSKDYEGLELKTNTYLLYSGTLSSLEKADVKIGLWISYENITNEYMNSAFIGTLKVYVR